MRHTKKAHRRGRRHRAVVLIMVLGILATMTIVATAFLLFMRQSYRAATNAQFAARAELACRSGLEHAIRAIRAAADLYVCETHAVPADGSCEYRNPTADADSDGEHCEQRRQPAIAQ